MILKELRDEQGKFSGLLFSKDDIEVLKDSLRTDSQLFDDLKSLLASEAETPVTEHKMPSGLTVDAINNKASQTTERLYKDAFSKRRCHVLSRRKNGNRTVCTSKSGWFRRSHEF